MVEACAIFCMAVIFSQTYLNISRVMTFQLVGIMYASFVWSGTRPVLKHGPRS